MKENNLKKYLAFPIAEMTLSFLAMIFGIMQISGAFSSTETTGPIAYSVLIGSSAIFVIIALLFALMGTIKNNKAMFVIGSDITTLASYASVTILFVLSMVALSAGEVQISTLMMTLFIISYIFLSVCSILVFVASLVTGLKKNGKSSSFLSVASIIELAFIVVFSIVSCYSLSKAGTIYWFLYSLCLDLAILGSTVSLLIISFRKGDAPVIEAAKPGEAPAATGKKVEEPKAATNEDDKIKQLKQYAELKEQGVITAEEFEAAKKKILG